MCVCVFGIYVERWFWEFKLLIGSLVELRAWLHSCLCFSLLEKLFLKTSLTPGYLLSFQAFSYRNLDRSSIVGGSIEKVPGPSIIGGSIELLFLCLCFVPWHLLDSFICWWFFSWHLPRQMARHLSTPLSVENYWSSIYWFVATQFSFPWSLSIYPHMFTSQIILSHSKPLSQVFFKHFQGFLFSW